MMSDKDKVYTTWLAVLTFIALCAAVGFGKNRDRIGALETNGKPVEAAGLREISDMTREELVKEINRRVDARPEPPR